VPVLVLPGRSASTPMWEANLAGLAAERTVYAMDLLGEPGLSVQERPLTSDADQATWLAEAIDGLDLPRVHLLGVSIGGWTPFNLAIHAPRQVASLSLLDPANLFGRITWKVIVVSLGAVVPFLPRAWRRKLMSWIAGGADTSDDEPVAVLIVAGMREFSASLPTPGYRRTARSPAWTGPCWRSSPDGASSMLPAPQSGGLVACSETPPWSSGQMPRMRSTGSFPSVSFRGSFASLPRSTQGQPRRRLDSGAAAQRWNRRHRRTTRSDDGCTGASWVPTARLEDAMTIKSRTTAPARRPGRGPPGDCRCRPGVGQRGDPAGDHGHIGARRSNPDFRQRLHASIERKQRGPRAPHS
jgi:pimeloyl-ACP methyl ester carboxylesterase